MERSEDIIKIIDVMVLSAQTGGAREHHLICDPHRVWEVIASKSEVPASTFIHPAGAYIQTVL